jgi:hypothetical protein
MYEESRVGVNTVRACQTPIPAEQWAAFLSQSKPLLLPENSSHSLELQADAHSTAFLRWVFRAVGNSSIHLKVTYSEGYELESRSYPYFRSKGNRLDATNGHLIGPFDEVLLNLATEETVTYEPFWFRTFRLLRLELSIGPAPVTLVAFSATQVNYPLAVKAEWMDTSDTESHQIWDVSIRTLRNCMFDGYSDCPFYEQLQ